MANLKYISKSFAVLLILASVVLSFGQVFPSTSQACSNAPVMANMTFCQTGKISKIVPKCCCHKPTNKKSFTPSQHQSCYCSVAVQSHLTNKILPGFSQVVILFAPRDPVKFPDFCLNWHSAPIVRAADIKFSDGLISQLPARSPPEV